MKVFIILAQLAAPTMTCDVVVNGHTVTFPRGWLSFSGCMELKRDLQKSDQTGAKIECVCTIGNKT